MNTFKINNQITFLLLYFAEKIQLKFKDLYVMPKNVRCLAPWTLIVVTTNIFQIMMKSSHFSVTTWRNVLQELYVEPNVLLKGIIILTISFSWVSTKKLKHWNLKLYYCDTYWIKSQSMLYNSARQTFIQTDCYQRCSCKTLPEFL